MAALPKWMYSSWGDSVFRGRAYGSKWTLLHVLVLTAGDGWSVWIVACLGWSVTVGPEDPVHEGLHSVIEGEPRTRHRTWRLRSGRVLQLTYSPEPTKEATDAN